MRSSTSKRKKLEYPEQTEGSQLATKARKLASKLTREERRTHLNAAMVMIYGGTQPKETALAGR